MNKRKSDIDLIIFDLDGTILDTDLYVVLNYTHLYDKYKKKAPHLKKLAYYSLPLVEIIQREFPEVPVEDAVKEYNKFATSYSNKYSNLYPKEIEVLEDLKEAGYQMVLLTSKMRDAVLQNMNYFGLSHYIDLEKSITFDEVIRPKPDPSGVIQILQMCSVEPSRCFTIGDSLTDIEAGQSAHVHTGLVHFGLKQISPDSVEEEYNTFQDIGRSFLNYD